MALLARREHSRVELERKLLARGFTPSAVATALDALEASGALADHRFTEEFIRSRVARGQGPLRIRAELAVRGIAEDAADALLRQSDVDWAAVAAEVVAKKFGRRPPKDFRERAQRARFLQYRGFDGAAIRAALELEPDSD